jgi:colicin import membrane protein
MKLYYIAPVAALAAFAAYTMQFNKSYDAKMEAKAEEVRVIKEAKIKSEADARKKAMDDAMAVQTKLKKEREKKEAEETARKEARQTALDARDRNFREQEKLARTVERLKKEIKIEQDAIAKLEGSIKFNQDEKKFIVEFVSKAERNVAILTDLLRKIDSAEAVRVAESAKTAKNNS